MAAWMRWSLVAVGLVMFTLLGVGTPNTRAARPVMVPLLTPTPPQPTPYPTPCFGCAYQFAASTGASIVPGTVDSGNHCDECTTMVPLPFNWGIYNYFSTFVLVGANGTLHLDSLTGSPSCLPSPSVQVAVLPYWADLRTDAAGSGIFTSVSGVAPNRVFNMEWRATLAATWEPANFEVRLTENSPIFEMIYGVLPAGASATIGIQKSFDTCYTQYACGPGAASPGLRLVAYDPVCSPSQPTVTPAPLTPTRTATPTVTGTPPTATDTPVLPTPCTIAFTDVPPSDPFYQQLRCVACRGVVSGYSDGTFRGGNDVTRGQASKMISVATGLQDPVPSTQQTFSDVPVSDPFWVFIERLAARGAISGYSCGVPPGGACGPLNRPYFLAYTRITRGQMAKVLSNAADFADAIPSTRQTFTDVPYGSPFWLYIERDSVHGVVSGYTTSPPCTTGPPCYLPGRNTTRIQTVLLVRNAFFPNCETPER
ncbi:MAG TPA: S-layer homology domain-containing protein [Chloroflexia bacterium]|nr:S-layer homology domain-containing protein [Chloroflexia bacterium]